MRKVLPLLLTIVLVISTMTACGGAPESTERESETGTDHRHESGTTEVVTTEEATVTEPEDNTETSSELSTEVPSVPEDDIVTEIPTTDSDTSAPDSSESESSEPETSEPESAEPEHTHNYTVTVVSATCTEKGYSNYCCECGDSYKDNYTNAIGHRYGTWETTKEPTTSSKGEEKRSCSVCGNVQTRELEKLSNSHSHSYTKEVVEHTCTTDGYTVYTCACGDSFISNTVRAKHDIVSSVRPATCEVHSHMLYTCTRCDYRSAGGDVLAPALGHDYVLVETRLGNCLDSWDRDIYRCNTCGKEKVEAKIAVRHDYVTDRIEEPTCGRKGRLYQTCSLCGAKKESEIPSLGHAELYHEIVEPTCGSWGIDRGYCSRCNAFLTEEKLEPLGGCIMTTKNFAVAVKDAEATGNWKYTYSGYREFHEQDVQTCKNCCYIDVYSATDIYSDLEKNQIIIERINSARRGHCDPVVMDEDLLALAKQRIKEFYEAGDFKPGRVYANEGENIGTNCYTVENAYINWSVDKACRSNIMNAEYAYFAYVTYRPKELDPAYTLGILLFWTAAERAEYLQSLN